LAVSNQIYFNVDPALECLQSWGSEMCFESFRGTCCLCP